jgi:hypothetical protein
MKIRSVVLAVTLAIGTTACSGTSSGSDVTLVDKPVATNEAPKSNTEFCKTAALSQATMEKMFTDTDSEATDEEAWASLLSIAMKMLEDAPSDIRDEAREVQQGLVKYAALLAKYDYDFMAVPADELEAINRDSDVAGETVDKYLEEKCGIPQE